VTIKKILKYNLTENFLNYLEDRINVIDYINIADLTNEQDYNDLKTQIENTKKDSFNKDDFYVVSHFDTDYYLPNCPYGLLMFNFIRTIQEVDVSLNNVIVLTNIDNLLDEIKYIIPQDKHETELPIVIDKCLSICRNNYVHDDYQNIPINYNVKKHALVLFGKERVHRNALYNFINQNNLKEKIVVSYRNNESKNINKHKHTS